jgi:hypothetical protein
LNGARGQSAGTGTIQALVGSALDDGDVGSAECRFTG